MRRLKTRHSYHDAEIRAIEFGAGNDMVFRIALCGCSGSPGATVHLSFYGIQNASEVRQSLITLLDRARERGRIAEILDLARDDDGRILVDTDQGPLYFKAKGFTET
jgi:hypothetical protein